MGLLSSAERALLRSGQMFGRRAEDWTPLLHGTNREPSAFKGALWATPNARAASEYALEHHPGASPNVMPLHGDTRAAVTMSTLGDLEQALGDDAYELLDGLETGAWRKYEDEVWEGLDRPEVQQALRQRGITIVRVPNDASPVSTTSSPSRHESFLFLDKGDVRPRFGGDAPWAMPLAVGAGGGLLSLAARRRQNAAA